MSTSNDTCSSILVVNAGSTSTKLAIVGDDDVVTWSRTADAGDDAMARRVRRRGRRARRRRCGRAPDRPRRRAVRGTGRSSTPASSPRSSRSRSWRRSTTARASPASAPRARSCPTSRRSPASTPRSTPRCPTPPRAYGGPHQWLDDGLRRYGFHGLSHEHATTRSAALLGRAPGDVRLVSCHLGGGSSIAAVDRGRSVDTTMGFTPLDGLVMATRAGAVDPGLLLHLLRHGTSVDELDDVLERRSGVFGLSGVSADLRLVIAARDGGDERARLAVDVFVHRLVTGIGAMIGALGGLDAIVFTGGIGEHSAEVRARAVAAFAWMGAVVDEDRERCRDGRRRHLRARRPGPGAGGHRPRGPRDRPRHPHAHRLEVTGPGPRT